ncbi:MAG: hypothetical protein AAGK37_01550 [Pseudomonadota bacterium]
MADFTLTPVWATVIFIASCVLGYQYRRVWKAEGPLWQLWVYGVLTASGLAILGFVPLEISG